MPHVSVMPSTSLPEGAPKALTLEGKQIMLVRFEGSVYATNNVCSHAYALLTDGWYEDGCIECPLHQASFDVRTGHPTCGPATMPVATYSVQEQNGEISIDLSSSVTTSI